MDQQVPDRLVPLLCLLAVGALLGLSTDLAELADRADVPSTGYLGWSLTAAGLALTARARWTGRLPSPSAHVVRYWFVAALVSLTVPNLLLFAAVPEIGAPLVAVAFATPPLWTYVAAVVLRMERFSVGRAAGVTVALAGALLLSVLALRQPDAPVGWLLAAFSAPVLLAVGNIYRTRDWPPGAPGAGLAAGTVLLGGVLLLVVGAAAPPLSLGVPLEAAALGLVAVQALVFALLYALFFVLQQRGGPVYLSLVGSVAAVVGSAVAIALLGEPAPDGLLPGTALVLVGVALLTAAAPARRTP